MLCYSYFHLQTQSNFYRGCHVAGVDNWGVLHTHLVAICPDFDRSSNACRKKWKKLYDAYKANYTTNATFGNERSAKCKWYSLIDGFMHDRANVYKYVHASAQDEDPNNVQDDSQEVTNDPSQVPQSTPSTSQIPISKKSEKFTTQEAIGQMVEQSKRIADTVQESEAGKLAIL